MKTTPLGRALIGITLVVGVALFAAPLAWMVATTLKLNSELVRRPVRWWPDTQVAPAQGPWTDQGGREHELGIGQVFAMTASGPVALVPLDGSLDWGGLPPMEDEANTNLRLWAYGGADRSEVQETFALPVPESDVQHWIVEVANDRSFHRRSVEIETTEGAWATDPMVIGSDEHQDLICRLADQPAVYRWDHVLHPEASGGSPAEGQVRVRADLSLSSPAEGLWLKFTEQYRRALIYLDFWAFTWNSVYLVALSCLGAVIASSLVAFSFARLHWHGRTVLFVVLLATMMLPPQVTMVPQFLIWRAVGAYDTLVPLWLPMFFGVPFFVFLLRQFMLTLPRDLEDAARIDGCTPLGIWARVVMPLIKPALIAVAIFQFLATWNDFMGPLIYVANPAKQPLSVGVYIFNMAFTGQWGLILAAATMMLIPVLVMFFLAQRYFIEGVTLTGLKA